MLSLVATPRTSYRFKIEIVHVFKKAYKKPSSLNLITMLKLHITLTEKLSRGQKIFAQTIVCNRKLNEKHLPTRVRSYETFLN